MTNAMFVETGGSLTWRDQALPELGDDEVAIAIAAAGVNRPDLFQRAGMYPPPPGASEALGLEVCGTVDAVGARAADRWRVGDKVMALVPGGGYAERCHVHEGSILPWPETLSTEEAAGFCETAFTVWANVFDARALKSNERLFVHGATSGIGTMAAALAQARGHKVYGTAGSQKKVATAEAAGFTKVWNYKTERWDDEMTALGGCDLVLDMVGGSYIPRNFSMLRPGGRNVVIAFLGGMQAEVNLAMVMQKNLTLTGSTLRARPLEEKQRLRDAIELEVLPAVQEGRVKPLVGLTLPMAEADKAHRALEAGEVIGKVVLLNG
ncbi:MAG: NAD(P)H-quinone oxidoreductase [Pseudomonadota bacterium]